jgi:hypothetical protein
MAIEDEGQDVDLLRQCAAVLANISENGENQVTLIREELLPRLIHLGAVRHPEIQQDVAKCFASLTGTSLPLLPIIYAVDNALHYTSANAENHSGVFGAVEIKCMIELSESPEENCRRDALVALGNLAVNAHNQLLVRYMDLDPIRRAHAMLFAMCR